MRFVLAPLLLLPLGVAWLVGPPAHAQQRVAPAPEAVVVAPIDGPIQIVEHDAAYFDARLPQTVGVALSGSPALAALAPRTLATVERGHFEFVSLLAPTSASAPVSAAVTLRYPLAQAGAKVWVGALDGGSVNGVANGQTLTVGADGVLLIQFQPPARAGIFQLVLRVDDVEATLPFSLEKPDEDGPPPPEAMRFNKFPKP